MAAVAHFGCPKYRILLGFFGGHFGCPKITFDRSAILDVQIHFRWHFWPFQIHTDFNSFFKFWTKWPPAAILDWTTRSVIELVRDIWMNNSCVKFEFKSYRANNENVIMYFRNGLAIIVGSGCASPWASRWQSFVPEEEEQPCFKPPGAFQRGNVCKY